MGHSGATERADLFLSQTTEYATREINTDVYWYTGTEKADKLKLKNLGETACAYYNRPDGKAITEAFTDSFTHGNQFVRLFKKGNAYRNISFEREAYANEADENYLQHRKHYAWIHYLRNSEMSK